MTNTTITNTAITNSSSSSLEATIDGYLACWNTTDADERAALIERYWTPDAHMVDPLVDVTGHAELDAVFARFHDTYPGCSFRRTDDRRTRELLAHTVRKEFTHSAGGGPSRGGRSR